MWERSWSFIKKAGTIILLSTIVLWFLMSFGWADWKVAVAAVSGLIAKENVVGTFGTLFGFAEVAEDGVEIWGELARIMTAIAAYSFLISLQQALSELEQQRQFLLL